MNEHEARVLAAQAFVMDQEAERIAPTMGLRGRSKSEQSQFRKLRKQQSQLLVGAETLRDQLWEQGWQTQEGDPRVVWNPDADAYLPFLPTYSLDEALALATAHDTEEVR